MAEYAPGMRVIIRDEEWMIRKSDKNSYGNHTLQCVGITPLVKDKVEQLSKQIVVVINSRLIKFENMELEKTVEDEKKGEKEDVN